MKDAADFSIDAPAKTNLSLRVLGKRDDGFHDIETLMCPISLFDRLNFQYRGEGEGTVLTCDDPTLSCGEDNLVMKAVRAMERHCHRGFDVAIHLEKRIPAGAGLGGGSSDAAATLKGINHLYDLKLPASHLAGIAATIGSDVPFFCHDSAAVCTGRGEIVEPLSFEWKLPLLIIRPPFGIEAAFAYKRWAGAKPLPGVVYVSQVGPWGEMVNDLELPVFEKYLVLARLKSWLLEQSAVHAAQLSGSGSCVIAVLNRNDCGVRLGDRVREAFGKTFDIHVAYTIPS